MAVDTGITGLSIEDSSGDDAEPLLDFDLSVRRGEAARLAIDRCRHATARRAGT
jgi:2-methylisocitrate lyase-like PEP mutase family enzyme